MPTSRSKQATATSLTAMSRAKGDMLRGSDALASDHVRYAAASRTFDPTECAPRLMSKLKAWRTESKTRVRPRYKAYMSYQQLTLMTHGSTSARRSSSIRPLRAVSANAKQTPCHLASPREPPPGSKILPRPVSTTGSNSVPSKSSTSASMICVDNP